MAGLSVTDWRTIIRRIRDGKLTPIISDRVIIDRLPGSDDFVHAWAEDIAYPLGHSFSATRLAQYLSVTTGEDLAAKEEFLSFSKRHLLNTVTAERSSDEAISTLRGRLFGTRYSEVATHLGMISFADELSTSLNLLARLPLPIYITTGYFNFLELALEAAGKKPRSEICYWRDGMKATPKVTVTANPLTRLVEILSTRFDENELYLLCLELQIDYEDLSGDGKKAKAIALATLLNRYNRIPELESVVRRTRPDISWSELLHGGTNNSSSFSGPLAEGIPSVFEQEPRYQPGLQEPLVYHLHGLDTYPASLVLTEDDYLDFLVRASWDNETIPLRVAQALTDSSLLLLGYRLQDWDFRVLFRGLITARRRSRASLSLAIQLAPGQNEKETISDPRDAENYLEKYFDKANFKIYWGDPQSFVQELWQHWEKQM